MCTPHLVYPCRFDLKGEMILKILSIGNSFSVDTMRHTPDILKSAGIQNFNLSNLFIPGCSIKMHHHNAENDLAEYVHYQHTGTEWVTTEHVSINQAIGMDDWDVISIQHGTKDRSRYTEPESYEKLSALVDYVKALAGPDVKIAFNMAWIPEPESTHHEMVSYGGDQLLMYKNITAVTKSVVAPLVDVVSPAGTAVQNARPYIDKKLTRDNFHLSYDLGRYMAGLTFLAALCGLDVQKVTWCPEEVTEAENAIAKKAVLAALKEPYATTPL